MITRTIAVAIVVACLIHGGQSLGGTGVTITSTSTGSAAVFFNAAAGSALSSNIQALNSSLAMMQTSVDGLVVLVTDGQTPEIKEAATLITKTVGKLLKLNFKFVKALLNLASDKTIPIEELFEQFEKAYDKLIAFMKKEEAEFKQALKDNLGVAVAKDFETKFKKIMHELMIVAANADRLKKAVLNTHNRHDESQGESRASITQLVTVFASSIAKLKTSTADLTTAVGSIASGLATANSFLVQVIGTRNSTRTTVKTTRADLKTSVLNERKSALDKYFVAQGKIRTDLSAAIAKLSIFSTSKKLNRLSRKFDDSYYELYHFLRHRNRTDAVSIGNDYHQILENLEDIFDHSVEIFFYAMKRTYMRLSDVVFESTFYNDYCYTTYTYTVPTRYQAINTLISDCTTREKTRWMAIATAIQDEVNLLQSNSEELAMNIARCATYTNFITASADYNQAEACLKTNLEDIRELSFVVKPQFENLVTLVKAQVEPSKFRLENCFVSKLHELTALLKSTREAMNECTGRFDSHPRDGYEDDESDWYNRHRGEICEKPHKSSDKDSNERDDSGEKHEKKHPRDDIDAKPKKYKLKCKKREKPVHKPGNGSNERDSSEKGSGEHKQKKDKKHKKNQHKYVSEEEQDSGELGGGKHSSEESGEKDKKKPGGHKPGGYKPGGYKPGGHKPGGPKNSSEENYSDEQDSGEKKKPGGHKPGGHKPGGHKPGGPYNSGEEDCSDEKKDGSKEKWSGENSEEEFDRKKLKGFINNEEDIFNRKFGVQPQQDVAATPVVAPVVPAVPVVPATPVADGIMKHLILDPVKAENEKKINVAVKVVGKTQ